MRIINLIRSIFSLVRVYFFRKKNIKGNVRIGKRFKISRSAIFKSCVQSKILIGNDVQILAGTEINVDKFLIIGSFTSIQKNSNLHGNITIGSGVVFAHNIYISSGSHVFKWKNYLPIKLQDKLSNCEDRAVKIGDDCWIGANVVIMPGIEIGRGSVIGANSVVTRNILPYSIVVGSPAAVIDKRLDYLPQTRIDSNVDADIIYLYEGFEYIDKTLQSIKRVYGGVRANNFFGIFKRPDSNGKVRLVFYANSFGCLVHCEEEYRFNQGLNSIEIIGKVDDRGVLNFSHDLNEVNIFSLIEVN